MSEAEETIPLFFRATSLEKEAWNDHTYLRHLGDGVYHIYEMMGGGGKIKSRQSAMGTILGIALATAALVLTTFGGWR